MRSNLGLERAKNSLSLSRVRGIIRIFRVTPQQSSQPLCLHVNRGLERHGYPWVPTDQGPRVPCQVDLTCQKPHQPASGPGDLIHNPCDLGSPRTTSSGSRKTRRTCGASFSPKSWRDAASRSADHGIRPIITKRDLCNL
jgi:hypothetical protein